MDEHDDPTKSPHLPAEEQVPDHLWDGTGQPNAEVAALQKVLRPLAHQAPLDELRLQRSLKAAATDPEQLEETHDQRQDARRRASVGLLAAGVFSIGLCAAAIFLFIRGGRSSPCNQSGISGFGFTSSAEVICADRGTVAGTLPIGETLRAGAAPVELSIANIGKAIIAVGSEVSLIGSTAREHRLALRFGTMHAKVVAPPRLFVVETAATTAVDLGCEYDLTIDRNGDGKLVVQTGMVELGSSHGSVVVPQNFSAQFRKGSGASVPIATDAPATLLAIVADLEANRSITADRFIGMREADAVTMVHLLPRLSPQVRAVVVDQLIKLIPLESVDTDAAKKGELREIEQWRDALVGRPSAP